MKHIGRDLKKTCGDVKLSDSSERVLRFLEEDKLKFNVRLKDMKAAITRREILSMISLSYDPRGIAAPFLIEGNLCELGFSWDDPIDSFKNSWIR